MGTTAVCCGPAGASTFVFNSVAAGGGIMVRRGGEELSQGVGATFGLWYAGWGGTKRFFWARNSEGQRTFEGTLPRGSSFPLAFDFANATYLSKIESSLSIDSESDADVDTVSINANGAAGSLPFSDGYWGWRIGRVLSTLVFGASYVAGAVKTKSMTFGSDVAGVEDEISGLSWVGMQFLPGVGMGGITELPLSISPSNFFRARWKFDYTFAWKVAASLCTFYISAATSIFMAAASVPAAGW